MSYDAAKKLVEKVTGIVSMSDDMCINSCHAFTGPFAELDACYYCLQPTYDPTILEKTSKKVPRKQACTFPLGPQVQALRWSEEGSIAMSYQHRQTQEVLEIQTAIEDGEDAEFVYEDFLSGSDYLDLVERLDLSGDDTHSPMTCYKKKHVLPGVVIPGPNKPKNSDSFTFQSFHHISACQRENNNAGIRVWDGAKDAMILTRIIHLLTTADAVGLVEMDGHVGHHGAQGCHRAVSRNHPPTLSAPTIQRGRG